jgi:hypothetical protein
MFASCSSVNRLIKLLPGHATGKVRKYLSGEVARQPSLLLVKLKSVLDEFGLLSGLECNVDKTTLLQVGSNDAIPEDIVRCGFQVVEEVTVLGLKLVGSGADTMYNKH